MVQSGSASVQNPRRQDRGTKQGRTLGEANEGYFLDTGCSEGGPSCLQCKLPLCKYDNLIEYRRLKNRKNDAAMLEARATMSVKQVAERFGVSTRTVIRVGVRSNWEE